MRTVLKKWVTILLVASLGFSTGCWNRQEVEEGFVAVAVGVDTFPGNKLRFTEQISLPPPEAKGKTKTKRLPPPVPTLSPFHGSRYLYRRGSESAFKHPRGPPWQHAACYVFGETFPAGLGGRNRLVNQKPSNSKIGYFLSPEMPPFQKS